MNMSDFNINMKRRRFRTYNCLFNKIHLTRNFPCKNPICQLCKMWKIENKVKEIYKKVK